MDGLRGLAALTVFVGHAVAFAPGSHSPLLEAFGDGRSAVDLFFVLSGFVLALSVSAKLVPYWDFLLRRVFRIYPAYLAAIVISVVLQRSYGAFPASGVNPDIAPLLSHRITIQALLRYAVLIGPGVKPEKLLPVVWSLIIEMRVSLGFPLLMTVVASKTIRRQLSIWTAATVAGFVVPAIAYIPFFVLGILIADNLVLVRSVARGLGRFSSGLLFLVAIALHHWPATVIHNRQLADIADELSAAIVIVLAMEVSPLRKILSCSAAAFLGRVSYSFYLIHFPILLFAFSGYFHGIFWPLWTVALVASWSVSWLMYIVIERNSNCWRRSSAILMTRISRRLNHSFDDRHVAVRAPSSEA